MASNMSLGFLLALSLVFTRTLPSVNGMFCGEQLSPFMRPNDIQLLPDANQLLNQVDHGVPARLPDHVLQIQNQNEYLHQFGLRRQNSVGDGNCLFRAISFGLVGHEDLHRDLRQTAVSFISQNFQDFSGFFDSVADSELANLARDGTYAGQECILALSRALGINILVSYGGSVQDNRVFTMEHARQTGTEESLQLHIIYSSIGGGHYDAVVDSSPTDQNEMPEIVSENHNSGHTEFKETQYSSLRKDFNSLNKPIKTEEQSSHKSLLCKYCHKSLGTKGSLKRHYDTVHSKLSNVQWKKKSYVHCMVPSCLLKFRTAKEVISHLKTDHHANIEKTIEEFKNFEEFLTWKENEEIKNNVCYIKRRKECIGKTYSKFQYVCNRDGNKRTKQNLKRKPNAKGSRKVNNLCPSRMYVTQNENKVKVEYIKTHSHSISFEQTKHLPLPLSIKDDISKKLALGIPVDTILEDITKNVGNINNRNLDDIKYFHLINRKNILHMKRKITDLKHRKHPDDATSTKLWVEYLKTLQPNLVLMYKPQHTLVDAIPLLSEDFILILMTNEQAEIYQRFANRIICMDSTHKTNMYDFKLITILVVDEQNKGYPVAFCLSNREDTIVLTLFLKAVKSKCPTTKVKRVMTDDDLSGISAAQMVFGKDIDHYLCIWHVQQSWRRKLSTVTDQDQKVEIFFFLWSMLNAKSEAEFVQFQEKFSSKYSTLQPSFFKYFQNNYLNRPEKWALYLREKALQSEITTNMYIESFHNKLKTIYMDRKQNKRIDKLIYILLEMEKHYYLNRIKRTLYHKTQTSDRHDSGMSIPNNFVEQVNENIFSIRSSKNVEIFYTVHKLKNQCDEASCYTKCQSKECVRLCKHLYTCSCPDSDPLCKHIHKIHIVSNDANHNISDDEAHLNNNCLIKEASGNQHIENLLKRYKSAVHLLSDQIMNTQVQGICLENIVHQIENMIATNKGVIETNVNVKEMKPKFKVTSNKKIENQPSFKRTSKPRSKPKKVIRAPTDEEKRHLLMTGSEKNLTGQNSPPHRPSVVPYSLTQMPGVRNPSVQPLQDPIQRQDSFVASNGSISIPPNLLAHPDLQNRNIQIILPNGKVMHIKTSRENNGPSEKE